MIFDVDGTLIDSQHHILAAQAQAFAAFGLAPQPRAIALSVVGLSLAEAFVALVGPEAPIAGLTAAYKEAWHDMRRQPGYADVLYPGAAAALARLAEQPGLRLAIATGKARRGVDALIEGQGWQRLFATIQTSDDHPSKPDPSMIRAALAATGDPPEAAAMVGDTSFDMAMAVAARVRPLGVAWGYHEPAALRAAGAECVAEDFDALTRVLLEPWARAA